jgi:hypothetical protein
MTCTTLGIVMQVTLQKSNDLHWSSRWILQAWSSTNRRP